MLSMSINELQSHRNGLLSPKNLFKRQGLNSGSLCKVQADFNRSKGQDKLSLKLELGVTGNDLRNWIVWGL